MLTLLTVPASPPMVSRFASAEEVARHLLPQLARQRQAEAVGGHPAPAKVTRVGRARRELRHESTARHQGGGRSREGVAERRLGRADRTFAELGRRDLDAIREITER